MNPAERLHEAFGSTRRLEVLSRHVGALLPPRATVLDVGCGDGVLDERLLQKLPHLSITGIDVLVQSETSIPVTSYDGRTIPHPNNSFDAVLLVDVLHHCDNPRALLAEAKRVASRCIVLKDHTLQGSLSRRILSFMDDVGNRRRGISLPYNYWNQDRWHQVFAELGLPIEAWLSDIGLYPKPFDWIFGRSLHFVARLGAAVE